MPLKSGAPLPSKFRRARGAGEGNDVADVADTGHEHEHALEAEAEAGVRNRAVATRNLGCG